MSAPIDYQLGERDRMDRGIWSDMDRWNASRQRDNTVRSDTQTSSVAEDATARETVSSYDKNRLDRVGGGIDMDRQRGTHYRETSPMDRYNLDRTHREYRDWNRGMGYGFDRDLDRVSRGFSEMQTSETDFPMHGHDRYYGMERNPFDRPEPYSMGGDWSMHRPSNPFPAPPMMPSGWSEVGHPFRQMNCPWLERNYGPGMGSAYDRMRYYGVRPEMVERGYYDRYPMSHRHEIPVGNTWMNYGMSGQDIPRNTQKIWRPRCDIMEGRNHLRVEFEIAGVAKDHINLQIGDRFIILSSVKDLTFPEREGHFYQNERHFGHFYRRVELPGSVDPDRAEAILEHGILKITLPKRELSNVANTIATPQGQTVTLTDRTPLLAEEQPPRK